MKKFYTYLLYLVIYSILFFQVMYYGIGYFWDWSFPIFKDDFWNFFAITKGSWQSLMDGGQPLSYVSDYIFRFLLSCVWYVLPFEPEQIIYTFLVLTFSTGTYLVFDTFKGQNNKYLVFLVSLLVYLNPFIFYKILGGHINYLFSYFIFIVIFCLLYRGKDRKLNIGDYAKYALLFALSGTQIQFFIYTYLLFIIFAILNKNDSVTKKLSFLVFIGFFAYLIHCFWLNQFLLGIISFEGVSSVARSGTFRDSYMVSLLRIFGLSGSSATLIDRIYSLEILAIFGLSFLGYLIYKLIFEKKKNIFFILLLAYTSFVFVPLTFIYNTPIFPILRETGHILPLIFLFLLLSVLVYSVKNYKITVGFLLVFIFLNFYHFVKDLPYFSYQDLRQELSQIHKFIKNSSPTDRFMIYPFFSQYSIIGNDTRTTETGFPVNNSGFDMLLKYSGNDYIYDGVQTADFRDSIQWNLVKTRKPQILVEKGINYIIDLSHIYRSNYDKFVSPDLYDNNLVYAKTDKSFFKKMKGLEKVGNHIYKVKNSTDRLIGRNLSFERVDSSQYNLRIHSLKNNYKLLLFESYHPEWKIYLEEGHGLSSKSMFDKTHKKLSNSMSLWTLDSEIIKKYVKDNYSEELKAEGYPKTLINGKKDYKYYTENKDGTIDVNLTIYFKPQEYFNIGIIVSFVTTIILALIFVFNYIFTLVIRKKQTT
ncbi:hypothetical protein BKN14_00865 [Candidatus Gracilibacteria bacterium HOT-871]|nr:hypothetical protein BKN14_00865 [Candidatus Gracilibacteria bacterium HOT-871]